MVFIRFLLKENILSTLKSHGFGQQEKEELLSIIEEIFHHKIFSSVLEELPESSREEFLEILVKKNEIETVEFLRKRIADLDIKLEKIANELESEIVLDIERMKKNQ
ncbi:MAG: hypothetical protein A2134_02565 [Candidatus Woykebacteria bacterium RBG_16_39_9b]|uniref:Uncharacterized protein n=1 Tax=Candidatus Woykebacteria bacterium RBG_16_39_9b TaxID=1802595 RepID=A0A1G1WDD9_9BACT|nr:MAG: hypothetical protein A2134_02565 [Candidatus Woykebacteria bacterium RBG_16_39_9b]